GFSSCAKLGAMRPKAARAAAQNCRLAEIRSTIGLLLAGSPAMTLMFIDDSHGLHEGVANRRSGESEALLFQIPAHGVALRGRLGDAAKVQRPAAQHLAARELPDIVAK